MGFKSYMKPVLMQCWLIESQLASVTKKKKKWWMVLPLTLNLQVV